MSWDTQIFALAKMPSWPLNLPFLVTQFAPYKYHVLLGIKWHTEMEMRRANFSFPESRSELSRTRPARPKREVSTSSGGVLQKTFSSSSHLLLKVSASGV